jgi:hypothetical protein
MFVFALNERSSFFMFYIYVMKRITAVLFLTFFVFASHAQRISVTDYKFLQKKEDTLKTTGLKIVQGVNPEDRFKADSIFTRIFVRALKTKNSFYFPFDSIINVSKIYAPDSTFRIYTWQLMINENVIRQHGAIQMRTEDGSVKLFALIDRSDNTKSMLDTIGDNNGWMGAVYYKIIQKEDNGKSIYSLFGFDENNIKSDKKILDVLEFVEGKPNFGKKIFMMEKQSSYPKLASRFIMEFKKNASPRLTYDPKLDAIIFDELVSEENTPNKKWTLVPDGEQEMFKWKNGKWYHSSRITEGTEPANFELPTSVRDAKGNVKEIKPAVKPAQKPTTKPRRK